MGEEILTPGEGQVRAMILMMTNPLRSAANSAQLERAFAGLDYLVAIDFYLNETTRHAHLILPTPAPSEQPGYELGLYQLAVRNVAKWSSPVVPPEDDRPETWQVFSAIAARVMGLGHLSEQAVDDFVFRQLATQAVANSSDRWEGLDVDEIFAKVEGKIGPARIIDLLLRVGPHGDGFGRDPRGLTLARLQESPHGLDLGPLEPRLDDVIGTESGKIELAPRVITDDLPRLRARIADHTGELLLIGRRQMRYSNSFMHNLPSLVKGRDTCTLQVSTKDANRIGLAPGGAARITSRVGTLVAPVEITDDLMPGVVSLPHGWGHDDPASRLRVANAHPGVNANVLTDDRAYDVASGTAVLFGTPVRVEVA
jgi:anaerobic selenocysteine-containing dehydrogenase